MPTKKKPKPVPAPLGRGRGAYGEMDARLLLKLPAELREAARRAAIAEHLTESEWWRRAARERLAAAARKGQ